MDLDVKKILPSYYDFAKEEFIENKRYVD